MVLNDYTPLFQVEKKLRRIDNITIPEVSYRSALWGGLSLVVAIIVWFTMLGPLLSLINLNGFLSLLLPVVFIGGMAAIGGKVATSKMKYGKELSQLVVSWVRYRNNPRTLVNFKPWKPEPPLSVVVEAVVDVR